jgi:hypothetical protein
MHSIILCENSRTFIPGHKRKVGHKQIRDIVFERCPSAVVVVLNGEEKNLRFNVNGNTKTIPLFSSETNEEVCETIYNVITKNHLQGRPLVITGMICVGMGQTLTHSNLGSFTSAIFSHMDLTNDEIYQLFGRITGRMKKWITYCRTQVYCPTTIMNRCRVMEECAKVMAMEHNGEIVTQDDYRAPMHSMGEIGMSAIENIRIKKQKKAAPSTPKESVPLINLCKIYDNENTVKEVCKKLGYAYRRTLDTIDGPNAGFKETSLNKTRNIASLEEAVNKIRGAYGGGGASRTYFPCYTNKQDPTTLRFVIVIRPNTDKHIVEEVEIMYPSIVL